MEEKKFEFDERAPYAYFQNTACRISPATKRGIRSSSTAFSATARCMRWAINAAAISFTPKTA